MSVYASSIAARSLRTEQSMSTNPSCLVLSLCRPCIGLPLRLDDLQHEGSTSSSQTTVDKETEEKLDELNKAFEANRDQVINKLLDRVVEVKTELHRNLQLQQKA